MVMPSVANRTLAISISISAGYSWVPEALSTRCLRLGYNPHDDAR